jgi:uncharacterized membrane protein
MIISSVITLLPILFGVIVWDKLPAELPIHWNFAGEIDNYAGKGFVVFGMPLIMLFMHWFCLLGTSLDPKNKNQNKKPVDVIIWSVPVIAIIVAFITYSAALGYTMDIGGFMFIFVGIMMLIIGNYLPKCKQNYTLGIKVVWALENKENWNATHRFAGKLWTVGGILLVFCGFLPTPWNLVLFLSLTFSMVIAPVVYSYLYYKKHSVDNEEDK